MSKGNAGTRPPFDFEAAIGELESIVGQLEAGNVGLDKSIELFQRGVELAKQCKQKLDEAELKVKQLMKEKDELSEANPETAKGDAPSCGDAEDVPKDQLNDIPF
jgi:exodeoxyribonuclease VII small subunit